MRYLLWAVWDQANGEQAIQLATQYAIEYHQAGYLTQAEEFYLKVLDVDPDNVDANHLLGLLSHQIGNNRIAIELYRKAIKLNPNFAEANHNLGIVLQELGQLGEAVISYRKAISIKPDYLKALNNLGVALQGLGQLDEAVDSYKKALYIKPDYVSAIYNLAITQSELGDINEAISCYKQALAINPDSLEIYINLGNAFKELGHLEDAVASYQQALKIKPDCAEAHNNLGCALKEQGLLQQALDCYDKALLIKPKYAEAYNNISSAFIELGQLKKAVKNCHKALQINPNFVDAHFNLGVALEKQGHHQKAIACYQQSISLNPEHAESYNNLGSAFKELGKLDEAIKCYRKSLAIKPDYAKPYINFSELVKGRSFEPQFIADSKGLRELISTCLSRNDIDHRDLVQPALSLIYSKNTLKNINNYLQEASFSSQKTQQQKKNYTSLIDSSSLLTLLKDELFQKLLKKAVINDELTEKFLSTIRQNILLAITSRGFENEKNKLITQLKSFIFSLSMQCYWNEYVYFQTAVEQQTLTHLVENHRDDFFSETTRAQFYCALAACYAPLENYPFAQELLKKFNNQVAVKTHAFEKDFFEMIDIQLHHPLIEKKISVDLPVLTEIKDTISRKVQRQYEQHPYPRWTGIYHHTPQRFIDSLRNEVYPNKIENIQSLEKPDVLVAGCGTGYQPITIGQTYKGSSVLAIDLSLSSLAFAKRKADEIGISNIEFAQADVLNLDSLDKCFDIIECSGVLHHMQDPVKGWKALLHHLKPKGLMRIGLHSKLSRKHILATKSLLAERGFKQSQETEDIRKARAIIFSLEKNHLARQVSKSADFYSSSSVRDLVFHVKEHYFTLSQIAELLDVLGLTFIGFVSERNIKNNYLAENPQDKNATSLRQWERFEQSNKHTFANMYQFWVQKKT